jgi:hypothetical protein
MTAATAGTGTGAETAAASTRFGVRPITGRTWVDIAVLMVLSILGVVGFEPSFGGFGFLLAGLGGLAVGAATAIVASLFRLNAIVTVLFAVVLYYLFGTAFAVPQQALFGVLPTLQSLGSLSVGAVFGWADIVTLGTPIGAPQYIAVVPYVATWLVALVSTTLATRWLTAKKRTAWRFGVTLIGPVALYLAGILLGTDEPFQAGLRGVAFAAIALIWLGWRRTGVTSVAVSTGNRLRNRKLAGTAIIVAGAILLGGGAGFLLAPPNDERFVLREEIQPPFDPLDYPSPLAGYRHYSKQNTDEVMMEVSGLKTGDVIRIATLDSFTGKLWNVTGPETATDGSGSFDLVGRDLPEPSFITPVKRDDVTFTIKAYDDVWIPSIGYPSSITFSKGDAKSTPDELRYNESTGTAVMTSGISEGDVYTVDAEVQKVLTAEDLAESQVAAVALPPVVGAPDVVTKKAQEYAASASTPIAQLEAIRLAITQNGFLSHGLASDAVPSRAGHGADRVSLLLEGNQMIGDQEQYASAYALMARSFGYPARVVMGFAPEIPEDGGTVEVTGENVTAWVEVAFDKVGWVAFDPTPEETDIPQDQVPKPQSEPQPQVRQPPRADKDDEDLLTPVELEKSDKTDNGLLFFLPGWVWAILISLAIPAAIIFIPLLVIGWLKKRRAEKRRKAAAVHDQVAGAWAELADQYSELGYEVPGRVTRVMVADRLERQLAGTEQPVRLKRIAAEADEAVFAGREVDVATSEKVWTEAMAAVEAARAGLSRTRQWISRYRMRNARDWAARVVSRGKDSR